MSLKYSGLTPGNPKLTESCMLRYQHCNPDSAERLRESMIGLDGYNPVSTIKPKTKALESEAVQVLDLS